MTGIALVLIPINTGLQAGVCMVPDANSRFNGFASVANAGYAKPLKRLVTGLHSAQPGSSQVLMKGRLAGEDQFDSGNEQNRRQTK